MTSSGKCWSVILGFLSALVITAPDPADAKPVRVTSSVDRNEMAVGDTFTYTVEVSSDSSLNVNEPPLPDLAAHGFEMINQWSGVESQSTYANGTFEVVQSRTFNYMLSTTREGTFRIPPVTVLVEGKPYQTQAVSIRVLAGQQPRPLAQGQQPSDTFEEVEDIFNQLLQRRLGRNQGGTRTQPVNPNEAFFIQVEVDKTKVYAGEQVTASWYLYTRGTIHDIDTLKYPSLKGFWKEEIEMATRLNFSPEVVNGIAYQKALLASYALFPIKAGTITVDSYKAKCTVTVPSNFGFSRPYQFTKASRPISIQVAEVPTANRPSNFTGAVGQFSATARVDELNVAAHQPLSYRLKFEGRGNAKLIDLPPLNLPAGVEIYDTKNEAKFFKDGSSYKEFEVILIPRTPGPLVLPAVSISAFDPVTSKFSTVETKAVTLNVLQGVAPPTGVPLAMAGGKPDEKAAEPALPPLLLGWEANRSNFPLPPWTLWTTLYAFVFAGLAWRLISTGEMFQRRQDFQKLIKKRLDLVSKLVDQGKWREVGVQGTNLLYFALGRLTESGGAGQELQKVLLELAPSARRELSGPATKILKELELLSFAPADLVGDRKEKKALKSLLKELSALSLRAAAVASSTEDQPADTESI